VGSGTGAISAELSEICSACVYGVDINQAFLELAMRSIPTANFSRADAHFTPFPPNIFEITLCHFFLLWVDDPDAILREMIRITQPGGAVAAMAEPDYGGRIDYPSELSVLGEWQQEALRAQGADPLIGRRLRELFQEAGLEKVESGVLGGQWSGSASSSELDSEWEMLQSDLHDHIEFNRQADVLRELDRTSRENGTRILFVPTFYAWGLIP